MNFKTKNRGRDSMWSQVPQHSHVGAVTGKHWKHRRKDPEKA